MASMDNIIKRLEKMLFKDRFFGVYMAKPTGKLLEEDKTFIQIRFKGKTRYAKPAFPFGWVNVPDEEWLKKHKDEIAIWIMFEHGKKAYPIWLGVAPLSNKIPEGSYPFASYFKTTMFNMIYDDTNELYELKHENGNSFNLTKDFVSLLHKDGQQVKIDKSATILGKKSGAKEYAVLSDQLITVMSSLIDQIVAITVVSPVGNTSPPINAPAILALKAQLQNIKSKSIKLD